MHFFCNHIKTYLFGCITYKNFTYLLYISGKLNIAHLTLIKKGKINILTKTINLTFNNLLLFFFTSYKKSKYIKKKLSINIKFSFSIVVFLIFFSLIYIHNIKEYYCIYVLIIIYYTMYWSNLFHCFSLYVQLLYKNSCCV